MSRRLPAAVAALLAVAAPVAALAMPVPLDHAVRLPLRRPAAEVVVGSPKYLDVTVVDPTTVLVHGKEFGATNLIIYDAAGRVVFSDRMTVVAPEGADVSVHRATESAEFVCSATCRRTQVRERSPWIEFEAAAGAARAPGRK